jgi:hypothetical protein
LLTYANSFSEISLVSSVQGLRSAIHFLGIVLLFAIYSSSLLACEPRQLSRQRLHNGLIHTLLEALIFPHNHQNYALCLHLCIFRRHTFRILGRRPIFLPEVSSSSWLADQLFDDTRICERRVMCLSCGGSRHTGTRKF